MEDRKIALVTGANRGICFEIVRQLGERGLFVFLSARKADAGIKAVERLRKKNLDVDFLQIDVSSEDSIREAAEEFSKKVDKLDILVNNAGIMIDKGNILVLDRKTLQRTLDVNAIGAHLVIKEFLPFMKRGSRIINLSSGIGSLTNMAGYSPAYALSKTMINAITRQYAVTLRSAGIAVNSVCPGWVQTAMGGQSATRPVEKGAETPVWLATEAPIDITGRFLRDKKDLPW